MKKLIFACMMVGIVLLFSSCESKTELSIPIKVITKAPTKTVDNTISPTEMIPDDRSKSIGNLISDGSKKFIATYVPKRFTKAYQTELTTEQVESLKHYLEQIKISEDNSDTVETITDYWFTIGFWSKDSSEYTEIRFAEQIMYLLTGKTESTVHIDQIYAYDPSSIPEDVKVYHAVMTRENVEQMIKDYLSYEIITKPGTYSMRSGYQIDLDGDGRLDALYIGTLGPITYSEDTQKMYLHPEYGHKVSLDFYVNGVSAGRHIVENTQVMTFDIIDLDKKDGKYELLVFDEKEIYKKPMISIYRYEDGQMRLLKRMEVMDLNYQLIKDSNEGESYCFQVAEQYSIINTYIVTVPWRLTKDDEMTEPDFLVPDDSYELELKYTINAYETMNLNSSRVEVDPQNVYVTAFDHKHWIQLRLEDQSKVWIYIKEGGDGVYIPPEDILSKDFDMDTYVDLDYSLPLFKHSDDVQ